MRKLGFVFVLLVLATAAVADDGSTPIPFTDPYATPQVISGPGSYVVTRNLNPTGPGPIVVVECPAFPNPPADAVYIDLNGFTLANLPNFGDPVIRIVGTGTCEVIIRNGDLIGGSHGVLSDPIRKLVLEDVEIKESNQQGLLASDIESFAIRRSTFIGTAGAAIEISGGIHKSGVITDNVIRRTGEGIRIEFAQAIEISRNRLNEINGSTGGYGIQLDINSSCLLEKNLIENVFGPLGNGIELRQSSCKLYNNVVRRVSGEGIFVDGGTENCFLLDNVVSEATRNGILVEGKRCHFERNTTNSNGLIGFHVLLGATEHTVGRNSSISNNTSGGAPPCGPLFPDYCDLNGGGFNFSYTDNLFSGVLF
ncbi:MAG: right-handed parallel beta-helix repeat-containing protein [bacterium]|nr:right-handed parallel beta-helix repeat-containing protein [bacterium]